MTTGVYYFDFFLEGNITLIILEKVAKFHSFSINVSKVMVGGLQEPPIANRVNAVSGFLKIQKEKG